MTGLVSIPDVPILTIDLPVLDAPILDISATGVLAPSMLALGDFLSNSSLAIFAFLITKIAMRR